MNNSGVVNNDQKYHSLMLFDNNFQNISNTIISTEDRMVYYTFCNDVTCFVASVIVNHGHSVLKH